MSPRKPSVEEARKAERGISCRHCGCGHLRVVYVRKAPLGQVMRRRECRNCGRRMTTYESTR